MEENTTQQNAAVYSLYSLLESAKLSDYYEKFLGQGGDDIDQLCEATENEFKEITKLVGMHTKPLHIRRLQKALVEFWSEKQKTGEKLRSNSLGRSWVETWNTGQTSQPKSNISITKPTTTTIRITTAGSPVVHESPQSTPKRGRPAKNQKRMKTNVFELKLPAMEAIIDWENLDDERKQLIREHSRIYGRDSKKRKSADLNGHEQMINEAAAQLCLRDPTLLVRRDELFTQARRIVRDSGFSFVHGHSRSKFAGESGGEILSDKDLFGAGSKSSRQERLQEIDAVVEKLKERQDVLTRKKKELENLSQPTGDLQQELTNLHSQLSKLQTEQKELHTKQRRSDRYYRNKEASRRPTLSINDGSQGTETEVPMSEEIPAGDISEEQHPVVMTEILHSPADSNSQPDHNSSEDPSRGRTLFAIIPQQQITDSVPASATLDQTTINALLNLANEEKSITNTPDSPSPQERRNQTSISPRASVLKPALQNILGQSGLSSNQISPLSVQQLISQLMSTTSPDQTNITQEQQQYVQRDLTVVEHLTTSSSPTDLINQASSTSHAVVTSLQDTSHMVQDQYVQQPRVPLMQEVIECNTQDR